MPWLAPGNRDEFEVVRKFSARSAISNTERIFNEGERVICAHPEASTVMLETGGAFFLVDQSVFQASSKRRNPGA
jgi:hypothetical protein